MINIFTAVVIALASSALGFLVGWLFAKAKDDAKPVEHVKRVMYREDDMPIRLVLLEED
jgi:accessory gene regulator protein AgrB